jgi:hypothetical protein
MSNKRAGIERRIALISRGVRGNLENDVHRDFVRKYRVRGVLGTKKMPEQIVRGQIVRGHQKSEQVAAF